MTDSQILNATLGGDGPFRGKPLRVAIAHTLLMQCQHKSWNEAMGIVLCAYEVERRAASIGTEAVMLPSSAPQTS